MIKRIIIFPFCLCLMISCHWDLSPNDDKNQKQKSNVIIYGETNSTHSTPAGNLAASAIKEINQVDFVFYPNPLFPAKKSLYFNPEKGIENIKLIRDLYPSGTPDQFLIGFMKGSDIKNFVFERLNSTYLPELDVAGLIYEANFVGGVPVFFQILGDRGQQIMNDKNYQVAIGRSFYFSSNTFPGYLFGNGFNSRFLPTGKVVSAQESVEQYLTNLRPDLLPDFNQIRGSVILSKLGDMGEVKIYQIQGSSHRSPFLGHQVTTNGVVTGIGDLEWYPHGREVVIQDREGDNNPKTSDGIVVYLSENQLETEVNIGDMLEVSGTVYERTYQEGLSITCLREITKFKIVSSKNPLPPAVEIGLDPDSKRQIPTKNFSTFHGNLNDKLELNLNDGIDFWESLENMRIKIKNPRIVGFRGGRQELLETQKAKGYLTFYVLPDGDETSNFDTDVGGILTDFARHNFHPQILPISTGPLTWGISTDLIAKVGDILWGEIEGILYYDRNIFGGGYYNLVLPQGSTVLQNYFGVNRVRSVFEREKTSFTSDAKSLTVASFNVENLSANNKFRVEEIAKTVQYTLQCPDIINFVEIQDQNGEDFSGGTGAAQTLNELKELVKCPEVEYQFLNIDPRANADGGVPGGNIQLALFYNEKKLNFQSRESANSHKDELQILPDGTLNVNPGKLFTYDSDFHSIRKSLVAEFEFQGERLFVIGNHFNSKLGDDSLWSAEQPVAFNSELRRGRVARKLNDFLFQLVKRAPEAHLVVLGDFNAYDSELSMGILGQGILVNLMNYKDLVPFNSRYTINYNGNSQPIDHLFVGKSLLAKNPKMEILHINSNYMGQISDHDPIVAKFDF